MRDRHGVHFDDDLYSFRVRRTREVNGATPRIDQRGAAKLIRIVLWCIAAVALVSGVIWLGAAGAILFGIVR